MEVPSPDLGPVKCIVLAGFMGAGKTTVGRALAARLRWDFADLDDAVSQREEMTVPAIFTERGEAAFRAAEVVALGHLLREPNRVIALGGGAPETPGIQDLLRGDERIAVVHLHAPFEVLFDRCLEQAQDSRATHRPLLGTRIAAAERYQRRHPVYTRIAHHVADAAAPPDRTVDDLLKQLQQTPQEI